MASFATNCLVDTLAAKVNLKCLNPLSQNTYQLADIVSMMDDDLSLIHNVKVYPLSIFLVQVMLRKYILHGDYHYQYRTLNTLHNI